MELSLSDKIVVYAVYAVACFIAIWPVIGLVVDFGDHGHLERFAGCWAVAIGVAVIGKLIECLVTLVRKKCRS